MAHPTTSLRAHDDLILWALILSVVLHSAALGLLPGFTFNKVIKTIEPLTVELQQLPPPVIEPPKPKPPEPPKPKPPKPKLEKIPPRPLPQPVIPPPAPVVQHNDLPPPPPAVAEPPKAQAPAPAVIAVQQKAAEPPPVFTAPVANPQPDDDSLNEIRAAYGKLLRDEFAKHTRYPQVAALKGWEGKVKIKLQVDKQGNVVGTPEVTESSGYKMLDDAAIKTVLNSSPLPLPPSALQGKPLFINTVLDYYRAK